MKTDEEFEEYKRQLYKQQLKQARKTATIFGICAITALIALVYSFFQQTSANLQRIKAENTLYETKREIQQLNVQVTNGRNIAERNAEEAKKQFQRAEEALKQFDSCRKSKRIVK